MGAPPHLLAPRRIAANIAKLPELLKRLRHQGLVRPAGFERVGQPPT